ILTAQYLAQVTSPARLRVLRVLQGSLSGLLCLLVPLVHLVCRPAPIAWWTWLCVGGLVVLLLSGSRRVRAEVTPQLIVQTALAALVFNAYLTLGLAPYFLHYQAGSEAAFYSNRYYPGVPVVQVHHASSVALALYLAQPLRTIAEVAETATLRDRPYLLYA